MLRTGVTLVVAWSSVFMGAGAASAEASLDQGEAYIAKAVESGYWLPPCVLSRFGYATGSVSCGRTLYVPELVPVVQPVSYWYQHVTGTSSEGSWVGAGVAVSEDRWCNSTHQRSFGDSVVFTGRFDDSEDSLVNDSSYWIDQVNPPKFPNGPILRPVLPSRSAPGTMTSDDVLVSDAKYQMTQTSSSFTFFSRGAQGPGRGRIAVNTSGTRSWSYVEIVKKPRNSGLGSRVKSRSYPTVPGSGVHTIFHVPESMCHGDVVSLEEDWSFLDTPKVLGGYVYRAVSVQQGQLVCNMYRPDVCRRGAPKLTTSWSLTFDVTKAGVVVRKFAH